MSALNEMQLAARTAGDGLDGSLAAAAELEQQTNDLAQRFAALGDEGSARLLTHSAGPRLATVREHLVNAQQAVDAFVQDCQQAKAAGAGGVARQSNGSPSSRATGSRLGPPPGRLSNAERAIVDERKFTAYSMAPENPRNRGKWQAWQQLGYDVGEQRQQAADDVTRQLRVQLPAASPVDQQQTDHGVRYTTETSVTGPNGRRGTLVCVWQYDVGSAEPRMVTNWLEVHTSEERS